MDEKLPTYEAFWPFYVSQHLDPLNRRFHFLGTTLVIACFVAGVFESPAWLLGMPVAGYGFAWIGHFLCEKNEPATFTYPLWSLRADFRMYRLTWRGRMGPEIDRANHSFPART
jgi:hypothetical protein